MGILYHNGIQLPIVCAEAGNNHEGSLDVAFQLIREAKKAGADLVKFQAGNASGFARVQEDVERYRKYEIGMAGYRKLIEFGTELGIPVFFSVWSTEFSSLYSTVWKKVPARQCSVESIRERDGSNTFISIPHTLSEEQIEGLKIRHGIPLHCVSEYPAKSAMPERFIMLKNLFAKMGTHRVGYSDHCLGIEQALDLVSLGAYAVEKHFTLAHDFGTLRDHALSATPKEMAELVERAKNGWK